MRVQVVSARAVLPKGLLGYCYGLEAHSDGAPAILQAEVHGVRDVDEPAGRTHQAPAGVVPEARPFCVNEPRYVLHRVGMIMAQSLKDLRYAKAGPDSSDRP